MFTPNCRRCPLAQKLTSFVLNVSKSYTLCPLGQTQLDFFVKSDGEDGCGGGFVMVDAVVGCGGW
ncbi:hypothetical protein Hanom_Chr02g00097201 [Helianthus anomalus]